MSDLQSFFNSRDWNILFSILKIKTVFPCLVHWFLVSSRRQETHSGRKHFYIILYSNERILNIKPRWFILFTTFFNVAVFKYGKNSSSKEKSEEFQQSNYWRKSLYFLQNTENLLSLILLIVSAPLAGWINLKGILLRGEFLTWENTPKTGLMAECREMVTYSVLKTTEPRWMRFVF